MRVFLLHVSETLFFWGRAKVVFFFLCVCSVPDFFSGTCFLGCHKLVSAGFIGERLGNLELWGSPVLPPPKKCFFWEGLGLFFLLSRCFFGCVLDVFWLQVVFGLGWRFHWLVASSCLLPLLKNISRAHTGRVFQKIS